MRSASNFLKNLVFFVLSFFVVVLPFQLVLAKTEDFGNINPGIHDPNDKNIDQSGNVGNFSSSQEDSFEDEDGSVSKGSSQNTQVVAGSSVGEGYKGSSESIIQRFEVVVKNGVYYLLGPDGKLVKASKYSVRELMGLSGKKFPAAFWTALGVDPKSAGAQSSTALSALALALGLLMNGGRLVAGGIRVGANVFGFGSKQLDAKTLGTLESLVAGGGFASAGRFGRLFGVEFLSKLSKNASDFASGALNVREKLSSLFGIKKSLDSNLSSRADSVLAKTTNGGTAGGSTLNEVISGNISESEGLLKAGLMMNDKARQKDGSFKLGDTMGWFYGVEVLSNGNGTGVKKVKGVDFMDSQCVAFVKKFYEVTGAVVWGPIGNADVYTNSNAMSKIGFTVFEDCKTTEIPKTGDVFATTAGQPGHVGIINKVNVDKDGHGTYTVVSQNVGDGKSAEVTYKFTVDKKTGVVNLHNQGGAKVTFARPVDPEKQLNLPAPYNSNEFKIEVKPHVTIAAKVQPVQRQVVQTTVPSGNLSVSTSINSGTMSQTGVSTTVTGLKLETFKMGDIGAEFKNTTISGK